MNGPGNRAIRALVLGLVAASLVPYAAAATKRVSLGPWGSFFVEIPSGWSAAMQGPEDPGGFALRVTPPEGVPLVLLLTPLPRPDASPPDAAFLRDLGAQTAARMREIAEEKTVEPVSFTGGGCKGFYVAATDRTVTKPSMKDFKYGVQGALLAGRAFATFTILSNLPPGPEREAALAIVRSSWHEPTTVPVPDKNGTVALQLPGKPWRVLLDAPGFVFGPTQEKTEGKGIALQGKTADGEYFVTAFLETSVPGHTAAMHRDESWAILQKNPELHFTAVKLSESGDRAFLDRMAPEFRGERVDQRNLNVYAVKDGLWLDVHVSKAHYAPGDAERLEKLVGSVRFEDRP